MLATPLSADQVTYRVLVAGEDTGHLIVDRSERQFSIDFDYKQNGRGPTFTESLQLDERGFPVNWKIVGTTTFGSPVEEYFQADDDVARWRDASGPGDATYKSDPHFTLIKMGAVMPTPCSCVRCCKVPMGKSPSIPAVRHQ